MTNIDYYDYYYHDGLMDIYIEATELGAQEQILKKMGELENLRGNIIYILKKCCYLFGATFLGNPICQIITLLISRTFVDEKTHTSID